MSRVFTVRELTRAIRDAIEGGFPYVWVQGQVSNLSRPSSGHLYFTLKDEEAALNCVWFRGSQRDAETFDPLTGEVFEDGPRPGLSRTVRNGQELLCAGRLTVYAPRGGYQLVVEMAQDAGLGRLHLAFEELKRRLSAKGYFAVERKRPLPRSPRRVAVVTAPRGAAIHDFLRIAGERGVGCEIRIHPVPVQGAEAPPRIAAAISEAGRLGWAEVIVVIRGGGSLEDLWAFNDEAVADAIYASPVPVLAGVGHEVDFTMADMTADVRAATPSHAAQLLWRERREFVQGLDELEMRLSRAFDRAFTTGEGRLAALERALGWLSPVRALDRYDERFAESASRLARAWEAGYRLRSQRVEKLVAALRHSFGPEALEKRQARLQTLHASLIHAGQTQLNTVERRVENLGVLLAALDPEAPLQRGYSLVRCPDGRFLKSIREAAPGQRLDIVLHDGEVGTVVTSVRERDDV